MTRAISRGPNARKPYNVLLNDDEHARLKAKADADHLPLGTWLRVLGLKARTTLARAARKETK